MLRQELCQGWNRHDSKLDFPRLQVPSTVSKKLIFLSLSMWYQLRWYAFNLENEKVMFHYDILFSYWIIWTSQLGSHWKWNGISVSRHNEGACNLVLIQFGIVGVTIPRDRDSQETRRRCCLLGCPCPCQGRGYIPRSPPGVDITCVPLQIWMLLYSSLSLGFLWPAYSHEVQPPRWNSIIREGVQQWVISYSRIALSQ